MIKKWFLYSLHNFFQAIKQLLLNHLTSENRHMDNGWIAKSIKGEVKFKILFVRFKI